MGGRRTGKTPPKDGRSRPPTAGGPAPKTSPGSTGHRREDSACCGASRLLSDAALGHTSLLTSECSLVRSPSRPSGKPAIERLHRTLTVVTVRPARSAEALHGYFHHRGRGQGPATAITAWPVVCHRYRGGPSRRLPG